MEKVDRMSLLAGGKRVDEIVPIPVDKSLRPFEPGREPIVFRGISLTLMLLQIVAWPLNSRGKSRCEPAHSRA